MGQPNLINTIFIDFDGVIRHWTGTEIGLAETSLGLDLGSLFEVAFSQQFLDPAITGVISDESWRKNVRGEFQSKYDSGIADKLIHAWESASCEIDFPLLKEIKRKLPSHKLILTTNGTSKLLKDLEVSGLISYFDAVVNSYELGVAKPDVEYFQKALSIAGENASACVYVDDSPGNIVVASELGITSELYSTSDQALNFILHACQ